MPLLSYVRTRPFLAALCLGAAPLTAFAYDFELVVTDNTGLTSFTREPAMSDSGDVFFSATDALGTGLFSSPRGGPVVTLIGKSFGMSSVESLSVNGLGDLVFEGTDATGPGLFSRSSGGPVITLRGGSFGHSSLSGPTMNDSGMFSFTAVDDATGNMGVFATSGGGPIITIFGENFGGLSPKGGSAKISNSGLVNFTATDLGTGAEGVFAKSTGGGALLTIKGADFGEVHSISTNSDDVVVTPFTDAQGKQVLSVSGGGISGTISISNGTISHASVNDNGLIVLGYDSVGSRSTASLTSIELTDLSGSFQQSLISVGDDLGGSTVTSLSFSDAGLNNQNDLAIFAELADGTSGIWIANIPSPHGALVLVAGGALVLRRRRR